MSGCIWSECKRVKVDYSNYLGPDYVYRYDGAGIHVSNHITIYDVVNAIHLKNRSSSFMGKKEMASIPIICRFVRPFESILVGRDLKDTKEDRGNAIKFILERAILAENGQKAPITIFPEGCTTNGDYVIKFKKGAFVHLRAVKPFSAKTWAPFGRSANEGGSLSADKFIYTLIDLGIWTYTI